MEWGRCHYRSLPCPSFSVVHQQLPTSQSSFLALYSQLELGSRTFSHGFWQQHRPGTLSRYSTTMDLGKKAAWTVWITTKLQAQQVPEPRLGPWWLPGPSQHQSQVSSTGTHIHMVPGTAQPNRNQHGPRPWHKPDIHMALDVRQGHQHLPGP